MFLPASLRARRWAVAFAVLAPAILATQGQSTVQRVYPGRGAVSSRDVAKYLQAHPMSPSPTPADDVCPRDAAGSDVAQPPELVSVNGVLETTMQFQTVTDSQGLVRYCFLTSDGQQAPTLRVNPGDTLIIHFTNNLPAVSGNMPGMSVCDGMMGENVTNIHFHGTTVAPTCGQDEVIHTLLEPGQEFDYRVKIPADQPPGLYWYHPHPHGISEGQVQGGASGALIVEGIQNFDPALAGMIERTFVIRDQLLPATEANDANIPAWDLSINYVPVTYPDYTPAVIQTNPGHQELWRIANNAADTILNLQYIVNGVAQPMQLVAMDGYPLAVSPVGQTTESQTSLLLGPGARGEVVVTTPNVGDQAQLVTQYWNTGPDGDYDPARPIANVVSQSAPLMLRTLPTQVTPAKLSPISGITPSANRQLYFSEVLQNPSDPNSPTTFYITEQGHTPQVFTMDQQPNIVVHAGTVEDWTVENRSGEDHIFHIHQLHFQVLEVDGQPVNDPTLRDTVDIPYWSGSGPYHSVKVRMDFSDPNIVGTFVYHCHILEHEDGGMMGEIEVLPPGNASTTTVSASATSIAPGTSVTMTAQVADAATGNATPTGSVQFELNGTYIGSPVTISNGTATLTAPVNGDLGSDTLTAFYEGDATYSESTSNAAPLTVSAFSLTSAGATAAVGAAAHAVVQVNVASNYTTPISVSCTLPAAMSEAACFVNPSTVTGSGTVTLTVNTTPAHPLVSATGRGNGWIAAGSGATLACMFVLFAPRRRWRTSAMTLLSAIAAVLLLAGCSGSGSAAKNDPGTAAGTYSVTVTGTSGSGSAAYESSVQVPITIE